MKSSIVTFGIVGAVALALFATTPPALAGNPGSSQQFSFSAASSPLILVRGGGGGGHGGGMGRGGMGRGPFGFGGPRGAVIAKPMQKIPKVAPLAPRMGPLAGTY